MLPFQPPGNLRVRYRGPSCNRSDSRNYIQKGRETEILEISLVGDEKLLVPGFFLVLLLPSQAYGVRLVLFSHVKWRVTSHEEIADSSC